MGDWLTGHWVLITAVQPREREELARLVAQAGGESQTAFSVRDPPHVVVTRSVRSPKYRSLLRAHPHTPVVTPEWLAASARVRGLPGGPFEPLGGGVWLNFKGCTTIEVQACFLRQQHRVCCTTPAPPLLSPHLLPAPHPCRLCTHLLPAGGPPPALCRLQGRTIHRPDCLLLGAERQLQDHARRARGEPTCISAAGNATGCGSTCPRPCMLALRPCSAVTTSADAVAAWFADQEWRAALAGARQEVHPPGHQLHRQRKVPVRQRQLLHAVLQAMLQAALRCLCAATCWAVLVCLMCGGALHAGCCALCCGQRHTGPYARCTEHEHVCLTPCNTRARPTPCPRIIALLPAPHHAPPTPSPADCRFAQREAIPVVTTRWVDASLEAGWCQDEAAFALLDEPREGAGQSGEGGAAAALPLGAAAEAAAARRAPPTALLPDETTILSELAPAGGGGFPPAAVEPSAAAPAARGPSRLQRGAGAADIAAAAAAADEEQEGGGTLHGALVPHAAAGAAATRMPTQEELDEQLEWNDDTPTFLDAVRLKLLGCSQPEMREALGLVRPCAACCAALPVWLAGNEMPPQPPTAPH